MRDRLIEKLTETFDEQYEKRMLITPQHTADSLLADGWIRPPCKVGDTIWFIKWYEEGKLHKPISRKVLYFSWKDDDITIHFRDGAVMSSCIGEIAFLSREEAEAKLKEGKG